MTVLEVLEATEGGTRTHLDYILTGLSPDFDMHLAYSPVRNPAYAEDTARYEKLGVTCHEIPMRRKVSLLSDRRAARTLSGLASEIRPRIIHAHSSKAGYLSRIISRPSSSLLVYTPHCLYFPFQKGMRRFIYRWGEARLEKNTDVYIAVSDAEKAHLLASVTSEDKVRRIDNGVELPDLPDQPKKEKRILFPARAVRQKGWEFFVATAEQVHKKDPDITFVFAGTGPEFRHLSARAEAHGLADSLVLPGFVHDMEREYLRASAVAVTSRWEGQPYSVLEAMSFARPVAAFDIPGIREIITHQREGLLAPAFDCSRLADHIVRLVQNPEQAASMGMRGRETVMDRFTLNRFLDNMRDLYVELGG